MDLLGVLWRLGLGLALFLFGMQIMGEALEKRAGERLHEILEKLTAGRLRALLFGSLVTAAVQSSSAVTVMTVGFVNAGLLQLGQAIGVVMGANIGTTVTAWLLSTTALEGSAPLLGFLKPSFFTPILGLLGIGFLLFSRREPRRLTGRVLLGFCVLMTGMERMSDAVKPLSELPETEAVLLFVSHPLVGIAVGAILTAVLQSSSASVGILQAVSAAGNMPLATAVPIVMGQNIGTCVTTLLASVGTDRNAKRVAVSHLYFNLIGTVALLTGFLLLTAMFKIAVFSAAATPVGIAVTHTVFNLLTTAILFPFAGSLERLAVRTVRGEGVKTSTKP